MASRAPRTSWVIRCGAIAPLVLALWGGTVPATGDQWLDEVSPIISRAERQLYKDLGDEKDRLKFRDTFWKMRDPSPGTPRNEYREEYHDRLAHAERRLNGAASDRGRIYILLGPPAERKDFSGSDGLTECELWIYSGLGRFGLPPMLYLLFFKPFDVGDYRLYYPGLNTAADILARGAQAGGLSGERAYQTIRMRNAELAAATVSVIPEEGLSPYPMSAISSGGVLARIMSLPDEEAKRSYLRGYAMPRGNVEVTWTMAPMAGDAAIAVTRVLGVTFLSYALMPETVRLATETDGSASALVQTILRIETLDGALVHQQDREVKLRFDGRSAKGSGTGKWVFNDLVPIVGGTFNIRQTFIDRNANAYFDSEERITVSDDAPPVLVGYLVKDAEPGRFVPFAMGDLKVLIDPRYIFPKEGRLEGLTAPISGLKITLEPLEGKRPPLEITEIASREGTLRFGRPLADIPEGYYHLRFRVGDVELHRLRIAVLAVPVTRPLEIQRTEGPAYRWQALKTLGREYISLEDPDAALGILGGLPSGQKDHEALVLEAQGRYLRKDFIGVLELLEPEGVTKSHQVLLLLGNSALELKKLDRAAGFFEELRRFGDTAATNRVLGAIYFSMGQKEKARAFWKRADELGTGGPEPATGRREE